MLQNAARPVPSPRLAVKTFVDLFILNFHGVLGPLSRCRLLAGRYMQARLV